MDLFSILSMIGGLALFLYGMHVMGEGLSKVSGGRLEKILEKMTTNPIKAVLLGAGVTAVIQSSSATTVMVVGFVNSGIMRLSQAVGIIMGANIGTTITSWILSLTGIESSNILLKLCKPTSFSPVLALIGVAMILFTKKEKKKDIGLIMVGFAVLMYGMDNMSDAVKPLADVPEFTGILTMFSNPVLGILAGAVLTAVIQSSSASVGILQALCVTGSISYATAIPIILGQNIGTCVTALLSAVGASKNAKKAALVHLYFNMIGTISFMVVFYTINWFVHFSVLNEPANAAGIAVVHTVFNVIATLVLMPFGKLLEKLANMSVPDTEETESVKHISILDSRFLDTPGIAMEQCKNSAVQMADYTKEALYKAISLIEQYDEAVAKEVCSLEDIVDHYEDELGTYLVKLSGHDLSEKDSQMLSVLLHSIGDFERISDHATNIMEAAAEMNNKEMIFSKKAKEELEVYIRAVKDVIETAFTSFIKEDKGSALNVEPLEEVIDYLNEEIKKRHIKRLRKGKCTIELGFVLSDLTTNFERISDHCSNIAIALIQMGDSTYDTHEYLLALKDDEQEAFAKQVKQVKQQYVLPE